MNRLSIPALLIAICVSPLAAQVPSGPNDFPQWRGPNRDGISADKGLLKEWPTTGPQVLWRIDDLGAGYSSVSVKDNLIVTMSDLDGVEHVIALKVSDGSQVWAVQPDVVAETLSEKVESEFTKLDTDGDGKVSEIEALSKMGTKYYKYDSGQLVGKTADRAKRIFAALDKNDDGELTFNESRKAFRETIIKIDSSDKPKADELANSRADELISAADKDGDGFVTKKEASPTYLGAIFRDADKRLPDSRRGDGDLTRTEIVDYFKKRERGQDGRITEAELIAYYQKSITKGDGELTRQELSSVYGGYRNGQGDGPRGTPTIDGDRVYAEGGNGDLTCLDLQTGRTIWHVSLIDDLGGGRPGWGYSESPLIVDDWVIVTPGGDDGTLAALNKLTGEIKWRSTELSEKAHYSSPVVATIAGVEQVVQFAKESMFGVRLADGKLLWNYSGAANSTANCCTPVVDADHVFAASAYGTGGGLAKITGTGDTLSAEEVYFEKKMAIHHGGIIKIGDHIYSNGAGTLICMDFLSGEIAWQDRSVGKGSLIAADGMLYVLGEKHELALVEATPEEYRERGRIDLESYGRPSWAHPVVTGGVMYIRDQQTLTAYKVR